MHIVFRRSTVADARAAADLWLRARRAARGAIPQPVHGDDDVRAWFASRVVYETDLWVAEDPTGRLAGILVLDGPWVEQLYVEPTMTGRGIGAGLLDLAKRERQTGLRLWTFASNTGAQRFYERHGFVETRRTDGRDNEEGAPDILYVWGETIRCMDASELRSWCLRQTGAVEEFPFGPENSVFKVAGKMFALSALERTPLEVSVKCEPELAIGLRDSHPAIRPGYHLNKRHWNTITLDGSLPDQVVRDLIEDSYDLVVSAFPKRIRERLGWAPGT